MTRRAVVVGIAALGLVGGAFSLSRLLHSEEATQVQIRLPSHTLPYTYSGHKGAVLSVAWSPDGKEFYFMRGGNYWALSIKDGAEYPVTDLIGQRGRLYVEQLATDGKYLYFGWRDDISDIWVTDVVDENRE